MSEPSNCNWCFPNPEVVLVPGTEGGDGIDGAAGAAGADAFTYADGTAGPFNKGDTGITLTVADSTGFAVGCIVAIENASGGASVGYFTLTAKTLHQMTLTYLDIAANTDASSVADGALISQAGPQFGVGTLPNAIVDSSGGTASDAIAAGVGIRTVALPVTLAVGGTGAADALTEYIFGHAFKILAWTYVAAVAGATGLNRVFNMEINTTDVSTVVSTITLSAANTGTVGAKVDGGAISGAQTGAAGDSFSIEVANGGTAFTAGSGFFLVKYQNLDDVNAFASLADHTNDLITALS